MTELVLEKLDKIADKQAEMTAILAVQSEQLKHHIARTDALEALVHDNYEHLEDRLIPVQEHVVMLRGMTKVLAVAGAVLGMLIGIAKLFI